MPPDLVAQRTLRRRTRRFFPSGGRNHCQYPQNQSTYFVLRLAAYGPKDLSVS